MNVFHSTVRLLCCSSAALLIAGCWTFGTTEYPQVRVASAPANTNVTVGVTGFAANFVEYASYYEFQTYYVPGHVGRHHVHPGYYETVPTVSYVPQLRQTDAFLRRAKDALEKAGFTIGAQIPDYSVDVTFAGPVVTDSDTLRQLGWQVCTIFFCDYATSSWTAALRVRDNRTGKLVFHNDYEQRYETNVFGLVPLISISAARETDLGYMQSWCLGALTDRIVADVSAWLVQRK
jgi:hypothetical protein